MQTKDKDTLVKLLTELRDERIEKLSTESDTPVDELRKMLEREPNDVYEMDDGDCLLQGIDNVLNVIDVGE